MLRDPVADWRRLSDLYEQAEGLEGRELQEFLRRLTSESRHLVRDLERMLGARARADREGFLEALPALSQIADRRPAEWGDGSRVGAYRLLRHLGSGGMAEVWLADRVDGAFERRVAIKLLFNHPTRSQRDTFAERFRRERDIVASLHHPNIASLQDAGVTAEGQPWLALEYVEGSSITGWCDSTHATIRERIGIFRQVLLAVEHAHANLIIHRDLKPSNILVTSAGTVKLLDFGIAKLVEASGQSLQATELTRQGGTPLTLQYASPEQLRGDHLTTASDVYSLGAVLYELLCGAKPFSVPDGHSAASLLAAIEGADAPPASRRALESRTDRAAGRELARSIGNDLDAIVAKAISAEVERRYPSVEALRNDLDRWAEGLPVEAQPPRLGYRARKFYLRHRWGVWAGATASAVVVSLTIATVVAALKAQSESRRALASRDFVVNLFRSADPNSNQGANITAREMLATGVRQLESQLADQPLLRAELLEEVAEIHALSGLYAEAQPLLETRIRLLEPIGDPEKLVDALVAAAENASQIGNAELARRLIARAAEASERSRLSSGVRHRLALQSGWIALEAGRVEEATRQFASSLGYGRSAWGDSHISRADALEGLASAARRSGDLAAALRHMESGLQTIHAIPALKPVQRLLPELAYLQTLYDSGQLATIYAQVRELTARAAETLGETSETAQRARELWINVALRLGRGSDVAAQMEPLMRGSTRNTSPGKRAYSLVILARLALGAQAWTLLPQRVAELEQLLAADATTPLPPGLAGFVHITLAEIDMQLGRFPDARTRLEPIAETSRGVAAPAHYRACFFLGLMALAEGDAGAAARWLREASDSAERVHGRDHPLAASARLHQALALAQQGAMAPAKELMGTSWPPLLRAFGEGSPAFDRLAQIRSAILFHDRGAITAYRLARPFVT